MGATRTSNKDILAAIEAQTSAINALVGALTDGAPAHTPAGQMTDPEPVTTAAVPKTPVVKAAMDSDKPTEVRVPASYLEHQKIKAQEHANNKGERVILYGRVNLAGEQKLAYCLGSRWSTLRDNGLIGAIATFDPK